MDHSRSAAPDNFDCQRSRKETAGDLSLSVKTIRSFRARLLEKLRLQSDVDLVHYAWEHRLAGKSTEPRILSS
jgi:Bacterial regulatory proteins, luxR family